MKTWSLRVLRVLLLPVVCLAHGAAVVWLAEKTFYAPFPLQMLLLI